MTAGINKPGLVGHVSKIAFLVAVLTVASAQSPSSTASYNGAGVGQDCTYDSTICGRGNLCLPNSGVSPGGRGVCRRPKENDMCDPAAPCDSGNSNVTLACLPVGPFISHSGPAIYFPGHTCVQAFERGQPCNDLDKGCRPGLTCGRTSSASSVCVTVSRANLEQDCSKIDCAENLYCKKNSNGSRRCVNLIPEGQPCNVKEFDTFANPCERTDLACVNGKCASGVGVSPSGTKGAACSPLAACGPGLKCLKWPESGSKSRCILEVDAGYSCDPQQSFNRCKNGLKCKYYSSLWVCLREPVPIGGKCVGQEAECADGLSCVSKDMTYLYPGFEGVCNQVSGLGGVCNPSKSQICNRNYFDGNEIVPSMDCVRGKCVNSTIGSWEDKCGPGTGVKCAPQDAVAKLECGDPVQSNPNLLQFCVHVNVPLGKSCSLPNPFVANDKCASGLKCQSLYHPQKIEFQSYDILKCVRLAADGQRCNYNQLIGCENKNSSCIRGVCTSA